MTIKGPQCQCELYIQYPLPMCCSSFCEPEQLREEVPRKVAVVLFSECRLSGNDRCLQTASWKDPNHSGEISEYKWKKKIQSKKLQRKRKDSMTWAAELMKSALLQICFSTCFSQSSTQYPRISLHLAKLTYMSLSSPTIVSLRSRSSNYKAGKRPDVL